jgi:hypothetical protein
MVFYVIVIQFLCVNLFIFPQQRLVVNLILQLVNDFDTILSLSVLSLNSILLDYLDLLLRSRLLVARVHRLVFVNSHLHQWTSCREVASSVIGYNVTLHQVFSLIFCVQVRNLGLLITSLE